MQVAKALMLVAAAMFAANFFAVCLILARIYG